MNAATNQPSILTFRLGQSDRAGHDPLAERSWNARLNQNKTQCEEDLKAICAELRTRLNCRPAPLNAATCPNTQSR